MMRRAAILLCAMTALVFLPVMVWSQSADTDPEPSLVINEIEINPAGLDTDNEWVEILNPTDAAIDLLGWQISYSYRTEGYLPLTETSRIIPPGGRFVFVYPGLRLRNSEAHAYRLMDPQGVVVEETTAFKDEANDSSTWQRFPDGGDPLFLDLWIFQDDSRNKSNS